MIFVTVGNATQGFRRLLESVDNLAGNGFFNDETVFIQYGNNKDFHSQHCEQEAFLTSERFTELIREADVIICHGGAGSLYHAFRAGKVPVVMPRRTKYNEHVDDQLEFVKTLAAEGRIIPAYEPKDLPEAIAKARKRTVHEVLPTPPPILSLIAQAIDELIGRKV